MQYYSTNRIAPVADFREATIKGKPGDNGLYFPEEIPQLPDGFIDNLHEYSPEEIAYEVIYPYVKGTIPSSELVRILMGTMNFRVPLSRVSKDISSLELFHGPTLTFKDVGARFMGFCLEYFVKDRDRKTIALVATSGDAGGAIANSFFGIEGVEVVILFPSGKLNMIQEKQLTTLGENIHAIEVKGSFEDCRQMVETIFKDEELNKKIALTSAGSANIARWLPEQFYYFLGYKQWIEKTAPPVISVPCGNFGNLSAGLLAALSGLPVKHFVAACNANDPLSEILTTEKYSTKKQVDTISHSMDIGSPVNFIRILELFNHNWSDLKKWISSYSVSDKETRNAILSTQRKNGYLFDPHGAVGYVALQRYLHEHPDEKGMVLATANPAKFFEVVEPIIEEPTSMPSSVELEFEKQKISMKINVDVEALKDFLLMIR
ncbi:MAG TPA: threonine synthase [Cytophaga sp.]|nr:threonine synthase [Cytophaga sp.]